MQRQRGPLLGAPDRHRHTLVNRLELAEEPHFHDPTVGQSPRRWPVSFATALAVRLSAATVPPQARCTSFIPRPAHRGKDPSLEEAFFDPTRNETDYHAGQLTGSAKGI
jgi:hypothetical protein